MNLLRPLEWEEHTAGGGGPWLWFRAANGLWFGTEEACEVVTGKQSASKVEETGNERKINETDV